MKKLLLFFLPLTCFAQVRNVQVNGSGNLITPSTGINFTSGQTLLASSGATLNFSAATVTLPATTAIPPPASPTTGDILYYTGSAWGKLSPGTSGFVLTSNGAAALPTYQAVSGSGTVTSVAATVPSFLLVAGSPITSSGTLAVTLATQSANLVFAGPASGSAAAPTFRSLATADFPASGVSAATYGDSTHVAQVAIDVTGRITSASNVLISGGGGGVGGSTGSTDTAILRANGTGGSTVQGSAATIDSGGLLRTKALALVNGDDQSGSGSLGQIKLEFNGGGFAHWIQTYHASDGSNNGMSIWVNTGSSSGDSSAPGTGNAKVLQFNYTFADIFTSGTSRLHLDSSGNLRLSAYGAGLLSSDSSGNLTSSTNLTFDGTALTVAGSAATSSLRVGVLEMQSFGTNNCAFADNIFYNGSNNTYRTTGFGSYIQFNGGEILFRTAPSGTGGTTATVTTWMTLGNTGALKLSSYGAGTLTTDGSGNVTATSDERLKIIRGNFIRGLSAVLAIKPINYSWTTDSGLDSVGVYSGFSAQNIQSAIPEAIGQMPNGNLTLQDRPLLAALVNSVKELNAMLQEERAARKELEQKLNKK